MLIKMLQMQRAGDSATCNGCLAHRKQWAGNNTERVKELWQKIMRKIGMRLMKKEDV